VQHRSGQAARCLAVQEIRRYVPEGGATAHWQDARGIT
jgi:hypothetical protein